VNEDAEVFYSVARRLFLESGEKFRTAHVLSVESQNALSFDEQFNQFSEAIYLEKQAIALQAEAITYRQQAGRICRLELTKLKKSLEI